MNFFAIGKFFYIFKNKKKKLIFVSRIRTQLQNENQKWNSIGIDFTKIQMNNKFRNAIML